MTLQELGSLGELLGALATIATLAYLATQIRQNTKAARVSSLQYTLDGGRDHTIQPLLNSPELVSVQLRYSRDAYSTSFGFRFTDGYDDDRTVPFLRHLLSRGSGQGPRRGRPDPVHRVRDPVPGERRQ